VIEALEPLASLPDVRLVILVSPDGVPVVVRGKAALRGGAEQRTFLEENPDSLAGMAAGWVNELAASIAPLGWNAPWRAVMRAARGTLVMVNAPSSLLAVVIEPGGSAEDLRLPMEGAVARMQRILRGSGSRARRAQEAPLPGMLPEEQPMEAGQSEDPTAIS
jgi:predicted regulator of Ras-like GTPase activity (Roadblock/LC7/MglB family)